MDKERMNITEILYEMEEMDSTIKDFRIRNRDLRKANDEMRDRLRRLKKENAQCVRSMQLMLKIVNICEDAIGNFLTSKSEENRKIAKEKEEL